MHRCPRCNQVCDCDELAVFVLSVLDEDCFHLCDEQLHVVTDAEAEVDPFGEFEAGQDRRVVDRFKERADDAE